MKILLLASFFPFPLYSGGQVRLYNLLRYLGKKHQITLVCESRGEVTKADWNKVAKYCHKVLTVTRAQQWSISNILKTGFSLYPFLLIGHHNAEIKKIMAEEFKKNHFDLIHVETFYVMHNIPRTKIPIVLTEHNVEWKIYKQWADGFWGIFLKPLLYLDVLKMKFWEQYFWKKAHKVIAVSDLDQKEMERKINNQVELISNGVDCGYFSEVEKKEPKQPVILFVGSFKWVQNRDAVKFLLDKLWPQIKSKISKVKLQVIGNDALKYVKTKDQQVSVEEGVKDIRQVYSKATILLAPIRLGGGTKFKVLESMAAGLPIVTTPKGVEGLGSDTNGILVGETAEELVAKTVNLLNDKIKREEIVHKEKEFVRRNFDWQDISSKLERVYENCS